MPAETEFTKTLWWSRKRPAPATDVLSSDATEVAVIGGGFTGLTAAWHLAHAGLSVRVFEAGNIGSGASGMNAGFVVPSFAKASPDQVLRRLGEKKGGQLLRMIGSSAQQVFDTIRANGLDCDAEQAGWLHVAHSDDMASELRLRASAWQRLGRDVRFMEAAEARRHTSMRHCVGALFDPAGGVLDPLAYSYGMAGMARAAGAKIHIQSPVAKVSRDGGQWLLSVGNQKVRASKVLMCTNAFASGASARLGKVIVPLRVYQIATEPLAAEVIARISPRRNPVADTRANLFTYRLDRENRLITGGMAVLPIGAHQRMAKALVARLADELQLTAVPSVDQAWRGIAAMTTDFLPHIYEFGPNFWGGIGCNGRGITLTHALARAMADVALGEPPQALPIQTGPARKIPFHLLAQCAPSLAVAQAKMSDAATLS